MKRVKRLDQQVVVDKRPTKYTKSDLNNVWMNAFVGQKTTENYRYVILYKSDALRKLCSRDLNTTN